MNKKTNRKLSILIYSNENLPFIKLQPRLLEKRGHKVEIYTFRGSKNPFIYLIELSRLMNRNNKETDLIHAYFGVAGFIAILQGKIPVITTYCGSDLLGVVNLKGKYDMVLTSISWITSAFSQIFSKYTTTISANLERKIFLKRKNKIIKLGVDSEHFQPMNMLNARNNLNWDSECIYILFPANRNRGVKRFYIAEQIIDKLKVHNKHIHLITLDKPNMYPVLPNIMNACNAMILVSLHEGSPNVVREAMACNLPIFSFNTGDVCEQVLNIKPGFVAMQNNKGTLIQELNEYLWNTPCKRSNGRNKMLSQTWENYIEETEKLYYKIVKGKENNIP